MEATKKPGSVKVQPVLVPRWIQLVSLPLLVLAVWAAARAAGPVLLLFIVSGVLALILHPVVRAIQRIGIPRGLAVAAVYVAFWAGVAGVAVLLVNPIAGQVETFQDNVPRYIDSANASLDDLQGWLDDRGFDLSIATEVDDALDELERDILASSGDLVGATRDVVEALAAGIFAIILIIVVSVYMLLYARPIGDTVRRAMPPGDGSRDDDFPTRVERAVAGYVRGQVLFSLIMGTSAAIALWIFGLIGIFEEGGTYAVAFGAFYGFMEFVPYIGPVLGALPAILVALLQDPLTAIWVGLLFLALQQLEGHVVAPLIFGQALRINPLLVIFALLFGGHLYGIIGALVALPVTAMLRETVAYLREHLRLEPWPTVTAGAPAALLSGAPGPPCPACGEPAAADDRHCRHCGERLTS